MRTQKHQLIQNMWANENVPKDWKLGIMCPFTPFIKKLRPNRS